MTFLFPVSQSTADTVAIHWQRGGCALFVDLPKSISWLAFQKLCRQSAFLFAQKGVKEGSIVAFYSDLRFPALVAYCSLIAMGATVLMLNPTQSEAEREKLLHYLGIDFCFNESIFANFHSNLPACHFPQLNKTQMATLTLTSGSSGMPKAVAHNILQHQASAEGVCELMKFGAQHSWLLSLPLFHVSGQGIVWRWLLQGATLVINEAKADFYQTLSAVSHASLVPTQLQRYLAFLSDTSVKTQYILLGGAHIPSDLVLQAQHLGINCFCGYGMTEMASTVSALNCSSLAQIDHVGKALKGREIRIEQDEIWLRGATLAMGYWRKGQLFTLLNQENWFPTKDRGEWIDDGNLRILGRLDNMFISGGENVQPENIEKCLLNAKEVNNIMVVPVQDQEFGARPVAFVAFKNGFEAQAVENLKQFAKQHLMNFEQPVAYYSLDNECWNTGIKISRKQLEAYAAKLQGNKNE